jgi:hypothetical protein
MKNLKLNLKLFLTGYLIATIVGFAAYYISPELMWILMFTLMPVVFGYLFYLYLYKTDCRKSETSRETTGLAISWIILSFMIDALVYIIIVPLVYNQNSNWTFFIDQTPWIWMNYLTIFILGYISRIFYHKHLKKIELKSVTNQDIS